MKRTSIGTAICILLLQFTIAATESTSPGHTLYNDDPDHLWNRIHVTLIGREAQDGKVHGLNDIDLLYWPFTNRFVNGDDLDAAIAVLQEFLDEDGEKLIEDPLKRALLQRDLWDLFDWFASRTRTIELTPQDKQFQANIVRVMKRIALTSEQIANLPNNYRDAIASGAYPDSLDITVEQKSYLPADLLNEADSSWVRIYGDALEGDARQHIENTYGHSAFWVYLCLPNGMAETWAYIERLRTLPEPYSLMDNYLERKYEESNVRMSKDIPDFPAGTQVALVEQAMLVNDNGEIEISPLTLNVQIRGYREIDFGTKHQALFDFRLKRSDLLNGNAGGLIPFRDDERIFLTFQMNSYDAFEPRHENYLKFKTTGVALETCHTCHAGAGVKSFRSAIRLIGVPFQRMPQQGKWRSPEVNMENPLPIEVEAESKIQWKQEQYDWGLLRGIWEYSE